MAKKNPKLAPLSLQEIILRGDADTIRQALEARVQIDTLLEEREAAYRRISELEQQVEGIVGEESIFPFPEPPVPVASFDVKAAAKKKVTAKPAEEITTKTDTSDRTAAAESDTSKEEAPTVETSVETDDSPKTADDA